MPEIPEANGEVQTIELVNEKTGEEESYVVHDVVEIEGETYYVLQAEADEDRVLILRREGESLVTLDDDEHDRVVEQLEGFEEEEELHDDGGPGRWLICSGRRCGPPPRASAAVPSAVCSGSWSSCSCYRRHLASRP